MIKLKSCPVCESTNIKKYRWIGISPKTIRHEIMPGVKVNASIVTNYFECQNCEIIFQNPRLSEAQLIKYYKDGYYRKLVHLTSKQIDENEQSRARTDAAIIRTIIGKINSHLDIGCGRGYLLGEINAPIKVGVELDKDYTKVKGIKIYGSLNKVKQKGFDLVTIIHTLEHVSSPLKYLQKSTKFLNKKGYLVIEVPTGPEEGGTPDLAHLFHFKPDVLKVLCVRAGLKVVKKEFTPHLIMICQLK